jgi:Ser/Thr protein kinase RdoA (MazF antagonist)
LTSEQQFSSSSRHVATEALTDEGLDATELRLLRVGTNAVFATPDLVVRVAHTTYDRNLLRQQLDLADWLTASGFPTATPLGGAREVDGHAVSFWERIPETRKATMDELGKLTRAFHDLTNEYPGDLPSWSPLGRLGDRLEELQPDERITQADCDLLHDWKNRLVDLVSKLTFELPLGPIHGDIHTGNVIASDRGCFLIDFDRIARGPREWDLADPLAGVYLFGVPEREWQHFVARYGYDLREFSAVDELVQLRALFMMSWLLTLESTPEVTDEVHNRLAYFRDPTATIRPWSAV